MEASRHTTPGLLEALLAVQAEAPVLKFDSENPHFQSKFASLANVVETVRPLLAKNSLIWTTMPCRDEHGDPALRYRLAHTGGEVIEQTMPLLLAKADPQSQGSAITYARRYALAAVLNLVAEEDTDGHSAQEEREGGAGVRQSTEAEETGFASIKQENLLRKLLADVGAADPDRICGYLAANFHGGRDGGISKAIDGLMNPSKRSTTAAKLDSLSSTWAAQQPSDVPVDDGGLPEIDEPSPLAVPGDEPPF